ncbi:hypothetical protein ATEIFO6365_0001105900 [Aspergillus terreus]|uniref:Uncharacterized protein n=1 Tax=Aspergillus terreus TaxID=33178 RepID=A0A5M3YMT1_ASPTE|nr:hypothetical protein ATETN484_0001098000 [Aspergillus terreus]GFF12835.1 hypothetical protein ATEIFO6365_0001105900 [Aspergillus terreus]
MAHNQNRNAKGQKIPRARRQAAHRPKRDGYANNQRQTPQASSFSRRAQIDPPSHETNMQVGALNQPDLTPIIREQPGRIREQWIEYSMQTAENASPLFVPKTPTSAFNTHIEHISQEAPDRRRSPPSLGAAIQHLAQIAHNIDDSANVAAHREENSTAQGIFGDHSGHGESRSWVDTAVTVITQGYEDEVEHRKTIRIMRTFINAMQITHNVLLARSPYQNAIHVVQTMIEQNANDQGGKAFVESELEATLRRLHNN